MVVIKRVCASKINLFTRNSSDPSRTMFLSKMNCWKSCDEHSPGVVPTAKAMELRESMPCTWREFTHGVESPISLALAENWALLSRSAMFQRKIRSENQMFEWEILRGNLQKGNEREKERKLQRS